MPAKLKNEARKRKEKKKGGEKAEKKSKLLGHF